MPGQACTLVLVLILLLDSMWWGLSYYTEWDREGTLPPAWDLAAIAADMIGAVLVTTAVGFQVSLALRACTRRQHRRDALCYGLRRRTNSQEASRLGLSRGLYSHIRDTKKH